MTILENVAAGVIAAAFTALAAIVVRHRVGTWRSLRALLRGRRPLRVSMSALLEIEQNNDYLLIAQGPHRPAEFGPIGGVYKTVGEGVPKGLDFRPMTAEDPVRNHDLSYDLRGTIPSYKLPLFLRWFDRRVGRESDALHREVAEELLGDAGLATLPPNLFPLQTELLHVAEAGPTRVRDDNPVYRRHEVFRLHSDVASLFALAETTPHLRVVTSDEIRKGMTNDRIPIGDQTVYLLGSRPPRGARPL